MKRFFTLLFVILCLNVVTTADPVQNDKVIQKLERKVDSLSQKVETLNIERNYFQTAINTQTGIFSCIVVVSFTIIALFSFLIINDRSKKSEARINDSIAKQKTEFEALMSEQTEKFKKVEHDINKQNVLGYKALSRAYGSLAIGAKDETYKSKLYLSAAFSAYKCNDFTLCIACLSNAKLFLDSLKGDQIKEFNKEDLVNTKSDLKELMISEDQTITDLIVHILSKVNSLKETEA